MVGMNNELNVIYKHLVRAKNPEEIFGALNSEDELKAQFHMLAKQVHPDCHAKDTETQYIAQESTQILIDSYKIAKQKFTDSTYGDRKTPQQTEAEMEFTVNGYDYKIFAESIEGDFCTAYFGERAKDDIESVCLKAANDKADNSLLITESKILRAVHHKSMPVLLDSFELEDRKRVNVFRRIEQGYDLITVREKYKNGLPQEHTAWVLDRLLSVLGYLHTNKVIHGAIEPGNIIITPHNHNGILIDYCLAIEKANRKGAEYKGINEFSAPEIEKTTKPLPVTDMYSLGRTMVYLLGGEQNDFPPGIDSRIVDFLEEFLEPNPDERKKDAWKAWHELKDLRTEVFGAPSQFLELKI